MNKLPAASVRGLEVKWPPRNEKKIIDHKMHRFSIFYCRLCAAVNLLQLEPKRFAELVPLQVVRTVKQCLFFVDMMLSITEYYENVSRDKCCSARQSVKELYHRQWSLNNWLLWPPEPFFTGPPWWAAEPVPEENFWTLWCKGKLKEADTPTIRLGATLSGLTSAPPPPSHFLQAGCPSCRPTNSVKALKATSTFGLGRRR